MDPPLPHRNSLLLTFPLQGPGQPWAPVPALADTGGQTLVAGGRDGLGSPDLLCSDSAGVCMGAGVTHPGVPLGPMGANPAWAQHWSPLRVRGLGGRAQGMGGFASAPHKPGGSARKVPVLLLCCGTAGTALPCPCPCSTRGGQEPLPAPEPVPPSSLLRYSLLERAQDVAIKCLLINNVKSGLHLQSSFIQAGPQNIRQQGISAASTVSQCTQHGSQQVPGIPTLL